MQKPVDLRSDTVTRPTDGMRQAMYEAEVGDDVFGDDPTVINLQHKTAELLGKEAALYMPSGTMVNQTAIAVHTRPGDEIYCEIGCHIRNFEGGAPAFLSGVMLNAIEGDRGAYRADEVEPRLRPRDSHFPPSRLIWVENSANRAGGTIFPQDEILKLRTLADRQKLGLHLDGARIWNVAAATGVSERELAQPFDSVSVCLSKGLGCPVGSLLAGSADFIERAHRIRKRLGGGMRQAGILAAAGIYALDNHRERLTEDHARARKLAETIGGFPAYHIDLEGVQTNIVIFDAMRIGLDGVAVAGLLRDAGVLSTSFGNKVRLVTHLDLDDNDIDRAIDALRKIATT